MEIFLSDAAIAGTLAGFLAGVTFVLPVCDLTSTEPKALEAIGTPGRLVAGGSAARRLSGWDGQGDRVGYSGFGLSVSVLNIQDSSGKCATPGAYYPKADCGQWPLKCSEAECKLCRAPRSEAGRESAARWACVNGSAAAVGSITMTGFFQPGVVIIGARPEASTQAEVQRERNCAQSGWV